MIIRCIRCIRCNKILKFGKFPIRRSASFRDQISGERGVEIFWLPEKANERQACIGECANAEETREILSKQFAYGYIYELSIEEEINWKDFLINDENKKTKSR